MANLVYNSFPQKIMDGSIDVDTDTIKVMLVTSSYTPNKDTHEDKADVTNEVSGTGYTARGATLANVAITKDTTDDEGVFDADDVTWSSSSITARAGVVYKDSGTDATSWLICYIDFGQDYISLNGDFKITWNSEGIVNINT